WHIEKQGSAARAAGQDKSAIRRKSYGGNRAVIAGKLANLPALPEIPEAQGVILPSRNQLSAAGGESETADRRSMACEDPFFTERLGVPKMNQVVGAPAGGQRFLGVVRHTVHRSPVSAPFAAENLHSFRSGCPGSVPVHGFLGRPVGTRS